MRKVGNLPPYFAVAKKSRSLNFLDPSGPAWPVTGVLYLTKHTILTEMTYKTHLTAHDQFQNYHKTYNIDRTGIQNTLTSPGQILAQPRNIKY